MMYTAGDVYAAQRELGQDRSAEWPAYIHWRALGRQGTVPEFDEWLDTIPAGELPALLEAVNDALAADDPPDPSSRLHAAAG